MIYTSLALSFLFLSCSGILSVLGGPNAGNSSGLNHFRQDNHLPALAALAVLPNRTLEIEAVGVRRYGNLTGVTTEDKFHLGSNTKSMTSTLIAILVENKTLSWNTTLSQALPKYAIAAGHQNTTLAMLGAHRSGITTDISVSAPDLWSVLRGYPELKPVAGRNLIASHVLRSPPDVKSNTTFHYSNTNYILLGYIIDELGISWEDLIQEKLWEPLGMTGCGFGTSPQSSETAIENPWPHYQNGTNSPIPVPPNHLSDNPSSYGPAGTVHCTMSSYAKYLALHLDGLAGKDTAVLKSSGFSMLHTPYAGPGDEYSPGGWISGNATEFGGPYLAHDGSNSFNYMLTILSRSQNLAVATFTNIGGNESVSLGTGNALMGYFNGSLVLKGRRCLEW